MPKIKNESYVKILKGEHMDLVTPEEFQRKLSEIQPPAGQAFAADAWKNFCILLFWSGRRPIEILRLRRKDISLKPPYLSIMFSTAKGGRASMLYFSIKKVPAMASFWDWAGRKFPEELLFGYLISRESIDLHWKTKKGEIRHKVYFRPTKRLHYNIVRWFGVPPYYFRHNRFTDMAIKGAKISHIKHQKGAKTLASVELYIHSSEREAKEATKYIY